MYLMNICFISFLFLFKFSLIFFIIMVYLFMFDLVLIMEWEIISLNSNMISMVILLDWMSLLFMSFVMLISSMVIYYSKSYMSSEMNLNRFIILVLLFLISMMLLIISPNLISILLGWDGLGLISYCLVIYFQNVKSYNAGMLTVLMNRVGDVFILISIAWMLNYGSWNFIFYLEFMKNDYYMKYISLFIMMAAMTKSAQIPFSSWLPAAMAAPTPVSALVHSSTLVTAGVYLMIRFNLLLENSIFFKFLLLISGLTMFMSGMAANFEFDLKKIIALSTLSQLGLMMSILSMGYYDLAFFHLLTHAMFKALLFMCAGVIIHMMNNMQDIRYMGGLSYFLPLTCLCFNISNLALCGFPFLAGFYSKDLILDISSLYNLNLLSFLLYFFSTMLTVCYTVRLLYYLMIDDFNLMNIYNLFDEDFIMLKSMFILMFMSLFSGSMLMWLLFPFPYVIYMMMNLKMMVLYISLFGMLMILFILMVNFYLSKILFFYKLSYFLMEMWFLPIMSVNFMNYYCLMLSKNLNKNIDLGWSEILSSQGIFMNLKNLINMNELLQKNNIKIYLFSFIIWMFFIFLFI